MRRLKFRLTLVAALTFVVGASVDSYIRTPNALPDCYCTSARCRLTAIADNPVTAVKHPLETLRTLYTARWFD
ncbi:MAG: hypothetical protein ACRD68_00465 [Pyrinomonadaceae bacterium]